MALGASVGTAYVDIEGNFAPLKRDLHRNVNGAMVPAEKSMKGSFSSIAKSAVGILGGIVVFDKLAQGVGLAVSEFEEARKVGALTAQAIKSTGGAANVTAKQVADLAGSISKKVGIDDEAIQSGANLLLTFKNVRNETGKGRDIFNQATAAAVDLSAAGFGDLTSTSKQLGKALNDPIKGMSALGRSGVTFSEDQKSAIEALIETGKASDRVAAQQIILKEVQSQVGGAAAAQATPMDHLKVTMGNLAEMAGSVLVPAIDDAARFLVKLFRQAEQGEGFGGFLVDAFNVVKDVVEFVFPIVRTVVTWFVERIPPAWRLIRDATKTAWDLIRRYIVDPVRDAFEWVRGAVNDVKRWLSDRWSDIADAAGSAWRAIRSTATDIWEGIRDRIESPVRAVRTWLSERWQEISSAAASAWRGTRTLASDIWESIRDRIESPVRAVRTWLGERWSDISEAAGGAWRGIRTVAGDVWGQIQGRILDPIRSARDALAQVWESISGTAAGVWRGIRTTISGVADDIRDRVSGAFEGAKDKVKGFALAILRVADKIPGVDLKGQIEAVQAFARGGAFARTGGVVSQPITLMGEEAPRFAEIVVPTNPAYRKRAQALAAMAAQKVGLDVTGYAEGGIVGAFNSAASRANAGPKSKLALFMAGVVESGMRNLSFGDRDSRGVLQIRDSTARGMGINNMDPVESAMAFLTRGFWGKGSANSLAARFPEQTAGWVAQQTQGSAHPGRYDLARDRALAFMSGQAGSGGPLLGNVGGPLLGNVGGALGELFSKGASFITDKLPGVGDLPEWVKGFGRSVLGDVTKWIKSKVADLVGGGGGEIGKGIQGSVRAAVALAQAMGFPHPSPGQLTSGGHAVNSLHYQGRAADFGHAGNSPQKMLQLRSALIERFGSSINELFFDPAPWYIDAHKKVMGQFGGHGDHIHVGFQKGGIYEQIHGLPFAGNFGGGGTVPGPLGDPMSAIVHGGEEIHDPRTGRAAPLYANYGPVTITDNVDFEREMRRAAFLLETA